MSKLVWILVACLLVGTLAWSQASQPSQPSNQPPESSTQGTQTQTPQPPQQPSAQQGSQTQPPSRTGTSASGSVSVQNNSQQPDSQQPAGSASNQTSQSNQSSSRTEHRGGGIPWLWVVIGLGVLLLVAVIGLAARGSGGVNRSERVERVEHHDDVRRAG